MQLNRTDLKADCQELIQESLWRAVVGGAAGALLCGSIVTGAAYGASTAPVAFVLGRLYSKVKGYRVNSTLLRVTATATSILVITGAIYLRLHLLGVSPTARKIALLLAAESIAIITPKIYRFFAEVVPLLLEIKAMEQEERRRLAHEMAREAVAREQNRDQKAGIVAY